MPNTPDGRPRIALGNLEWGVIASLLISAGSALFSAGIIYADVRDHEARLAKVELRGESVSERLSRIEANLDFLVAQYRDDRRGQRDAE